MRLASSSALWPGPHPCLHIHPLDVLVRGASRPSGAAEVLGPKGGVCLGRPPRSHGLSWMSLPPPRGPQEPAQSHAGPGVLSQAGAGYGAG